MDLDARQVILELEKIVEITKVLAKPKDKSSVLRGEWIPTKSIENLIADYYKKWNEMCEEHYKDYLKRKGKKDETTN